MSDPQFLGWVKSQDDFVNPLNAKQTRELFIKTDKVMTSFLPVLNQYIK